MNNSGSPAYHHNPCAWEDGSVPSVPWKKDWGSVPTPGQFHRAGCHQHNRNSNSSQLPQNSFSLLEEHPYLLCSYEPAAGLTQLIPTNQTYPEPSQPTSAPPPSHKVVQQKHGSVEMTPVKPLLSTTDESKEPNILACPKCGRTFVYKQSFTKHLASDDCCHPPACKKSRQEVADNEAFKSNTLPRVSRSKKVGRSHSTKKKSISTPVAFSLQEFQQNSLNMTKIKGTSYLQATPTHVSPTHETSDANSLLLESTISCGFCQQQFSVDSLYQRHCLAHALVIQLTRCLQSSLSDSLRNQVIPSSQPALNQWIVDQVELNVSDANWLRRSVNEVEQVLNASNVELDVWQSYGIRNETEFQNVIDLLMTQELDLLPAQVPAQATCGPSDNSELEPVHRLSGASTTEYCPSSISSNRTDLLCNAVDPPLDGPVEAINAMINPGHNSLDLVHVMNEPSTDVDAVEKLMASLLNSNHYRCSECGRSFVHSELMSQHICMAGILDMSDVGSPPSLALSTNDFMADNGYSTGCTSSPAEESDLFTCSLDYDA